MFRWVQVAFAALPLALITSMLFTRSQYRSVLPPRMWTPRRLYSLRMALLVQLACECVRLFRLFCFIHF